MILDFKIGVMVLFSESVVFVGLAGTKEFVHSCFPCNRHLMLCWRNRTHIGAYVLRWCVVSYLLVANALLHEENWEC